MTILKTIALLCVLVLCSCGAAMVPLKPQLSYHVKTIEVAKIEANHSILIRRVNPLFLVMGSSGLVADALVVANNASRYEHRAGAVLDMSLDLFERTLIHGLADQGLQVHASGKRFWDYFKPSQKYVREVTDGILNIHLSNLGFWSKAMKDGYFPSVMVDVQLIEPMSREVLYSDRFAIGIDYTSVKMMAVGYGEIKLLPLNNRFLPYKNFNALLDSPNKSREDLFKVMMYAAQHIAKGLRLQKPAAMLVFNPELIKLMPAIPLSMDVGSRFQQ